MAKLTSSNPKFVELFYGVVVGSAVARFTVDSTIEALLFQIAWVVAVLEDWFLYHRVIVDDETKAVKYNFRSVLFEFATLTAWYLGFDALNNSSVDKQRLFFLYAAGFYLVKVLAGVGFYSRHHQLFTRRMLYDCLWLFPTSLGVILYLAKPERFLLAIISFFLVTGVTLVAWWVLTLKWPHK